MTLVTETGGRRAAGFRFCSLQCRPRVLICPHASAKRRRRPEAGGNRMRLVLAGLLAALVLSGAPSVQAQVASREGIALQNQILELRHELQVLRDQLGAGGGSALGA